MRNFAGPLLFAAAGENKFEFLGESSRALVDKSDARRIENQRDDPPECG
jgi:hypothetical protein